MEVLSIEAEWCPKYPQIMGAPKSWVFQQEKHTYDTLWETNIAIENGHL